MYKKEDFIEIKVLDLTKYKISKNKNPLVAFHKAVKTAVLKHKALAIDVYVAKAYYTKLDGIVKRTVRQAYPYLSKLKVESTAGLEMLNYAPNQFYDEDPDWVQKNKGYIKLTRSKGK